MFTGNDEKSVNKAVRALLDGKLVAIPTETVYGLAANALSGKACSLIYKAKGRPSDNPLIIHIADIKDAEKYAVMTPDAYKLAKAFWPGPLTMILKKKDCIPNTVTAGLDTVAVRMPDKDITREIIRKAGVPLAAPSANLSGKPSPTKAEHVFDDYNGRTFEDGTEAIAGIIDGGECEKGVESTIVLLAGNSPVLLRPGVITFEMLREYLPDITIAKAVVSEMKEGEKVLSPGMKHRHYSPKTHTVGISGSKNNIFAYINARATKEKVAALIFDGDNSSLSENVIYISYGKESSPESLAKNLFSALRDLDKKGADIIFAEIPKESDGVYLAVYNRLIRACGFSVFDADIPPVSVSITGPSGAGKSSVCKELEKSGFYHIDTDKIAAEVLPRQKEKLVSVFGKEILSESGEISRKALAKEAFSSDENTKKLNEIMHPAITEEIKRIIAEKNACRIPVLVDGAAIFEAGVNKITDITVVITAPEEIRKNRISERDGISENMINERFSIQLSDSEYIKNSDFHIINDGKRDIKEIADSIKEYIKNGQEESV